MSASANEARVIEVRGLTKRYGHTLAVDDLSFDVRPGHVTGFLGPNGAGKSTTMRLILGLDLPTAGSATVGGRRYASLRRPLFEVGATLEARSVHPGLTAHSHLLALAASNGIPARRVEEVLNVVGLASVARKRTGEFSLGMGQRLGIAGALLGDPGVLVLDEPSNGLDPEGIVWVRTLLRSLAAEGRAVFVSSHLMAEMALTANRLIVIGRGRLLADTTVEDFIRRASSSHVRVRSPEAKRLAELLRAKGAGVRARRGEVLLVTKVDAAAIGDIAYAHGVALHELVMEDVSLEEAFMKLAGDATDYHSAPTRDGRVA